MARSRAWTWAICTGLPLLLSASIVHATQLILPSDTTARLGFGHSIAIQGTTAIVGTPEADDFAGGARVLAFDGELWAEVQQITHPGGIPEQRMGDSVAIDGDRVLIGTDPFGTTTEELLVAYLYRDDGDAASEYVVEQALTPSVPAGANVHHSRVALLGDLAVVSAPYLHSQTGSVFVFRNVGGVWTEIQTLTGPGYFGAAVALQAGELFVGGSIYPSGIPPTGEVHVFEWDGDEFVESASIEEPAGGYFGDALAVEGDTLVVQSQEGVLSHERLGGEWVASQTLTPPTDHEVAGFGASLAISGDTLLVGSPASLYQADSILVYRRVDGAWLLDIRAEPPNPSSTPRFGQGLALDGDLALAGDPAARVTGSTYTGAVLAFDPSPNGLKLTAPDTTSSDRFGSAVAVDGETLLVGAFFKNEHPFTRSGAAYVFERGSESWEMTRKLVPDSPFAGSGDAFGEGVAVSGDLALVGARGDDEVEPFGGAVYAFERISGAFEQIQKLTSPIGGRDFGEDVDVDGKLAIVGCPRCPYPSEMFGAAVVYEWGGTELGQGIVLRSSAPVAGSHLGHSVAIDGDVAVVGAPLDDGNETGTGAAYVFRRVEGAWVEEAKLVDPQGIGDDAFGDDVDVRRARIAVGAPRKDSEVDDEGAVLLYRFDGEQWTLEATLSTGDAEEGQQLGMAVSLDDVVVLAGSRAGSGGSFSREGSAHRFVRSSGGDWELERSFAPSDGPTQPRFGAGVAQAGSDVFVTADGESLAAILGGVVYVFAGDDALEVGVDVKPGSDRNRINPMSHGFIAVAVLGSDEFDASDIDPSTLRFGPDGAAPVFEWGRSAKDVDRDGHVDWLAFFRTLDAGIAVGDTQVCIAGETLDRVPFRGCDDIQTTPLCGLGFELPMVLAPLFWWRMRRRLTASGTGP